MEDQVDWPRLEARREERARVRRRKRKRNIAVFLALALAVSLALFFLVPWGSFTSRKEAVSTSRKSPASPAENREGGRETGAASTASEVTAGTPAGGSPGGEGSPGDARTAEPTASEIQPGQQPVEVSAGQPVSGGTSAPVEGGVIYPFTADGSVACGHWPEGSLDYPYFGAPREGTRLHAGIDIYPAGGEGSPVRAMKDGRVLKVAVFYTRYTGEQTYAMLIDHGDFVVNYAELKPPELGTGDTVRAGQVMGYISGTRQLHLEMYSPGTTSWTSWYGERPANLLDPTGMILGLVG